MPSSSPLARRGTYLGLFVVTLATLMYEILLTRIFSATLFYHFAFLAISVALFGMTVGALVVYLFPGRFPADRAPAQMSTHALLFAASIVVTFLLHLSLPGGMPQGWADGLMLAAKYLVISVPFLFSGVCVCLALTRFPLQVSRLYAADLAGAALGCLMLIVVLRLVDAPTAVFVVAGLAAVGALLFAREAEGVRLRRWGLGVAAACFAVALVNGTMARTSQAPLRLRWAKLQREERPLHERWNSFSRITVAGNPDQPEEPFGWGLSETWPEGSFRVPQLRLLIDGVAGTPMTASDGDWSALRFLRYDITNLVHRIRQDARVMVVGSAAAGTSSPRCTSTSGPSSGSS